jgi:hypothetical protein
MGEKLVGGQYTEEECAKLLRGAAVDGKLTVESVAKFFGWTYAKTYSNKGILEGIAEREKLSFVRKAGAAKGVVGDRAELMSKIYHEIDGIEDKVGRREAAKSMGATPSEARLLMVLNDVMPDSVVGILNVLGLDEHGAPLKGKSRKTANFPAEGGEAQADDYEETMKRLRKGGYVDDG